MAQGKAWFAPKRYGYGAGLPIAWQGWALLASFFAATALVTLVPVLLSLAAGTLIAIQTAGVAVLVAILIPIVRAKTEGGWRWRNGG